MHGRYSGRDYGLARCPACGFCFVTDPWTDFAQIYDDRYYAGEGADPLVDYRFELAQPQNSIRQYEWKGIANVVTSLLGELGGRQWLDYGCGNGGLVRHLRVSSGVDASGFDEGSMALQARDQGLPILDAEELASHAGRFDVISAIEVIEHVIDPIATLTRMRSLLRPGGLLFLTTGNVQPYARALSRWRYVIPEIHVSFFEPRTLDLALASAGFRAEHRPLGPGFDEILKFKVLKNLRLRRRSPLTDMIPASVLARPADARTHLSDHPIGWAH